MNGVAAEPSRSWRDVDCTSVHRFICDLPTLTDVPGCFESTVVGVPRAFCGATSIVGGAIVCANHGGTLAAIRDDAANRALFSAAEAVMADVTWAIGANDVAYEGFWVWPDGTIIDAF
jgi:hypothetical protein